MGEVQYLHGQAGRYGETSSGLEIPDALDRNVRLGESLEAGDIIRVEGAVYANGTSTKTENPDTVPFKDERQDIAMSSDGEFLAVAQYTTPTSLLTFRWNGTANRYEKTADPDTFPSDRSKGVALSSDGAFLAVGHLGGSTAPKYLITYKWNESNNRYEKTADPDVAPTGYASGVGMSSDGRFLAVAVNNVGVISYKWNESNNRYEKTAAPSSYPNAQGSGIAMSFDGQFLALSHASTSPTSYLTTYKWNSTADRYERTNAQDTNPSGGGVLHRKRSNVVRRYIPCRRSFRDDCACILDYLQME